ncbi:MAG TPA: Ig-like domain-containing protein [Gemmatimonadales bacterium]|nr:Ig-like domain-containing protein [Gemmatimonadales bacterium]
MTTPLPDAARRRRARQIGAACCLAAALLAWPRLAAVAQTVAEVQVTPETMTLGVGLRQTIFAAAYDRQGNLIPSAKFTFWSSDTLVARVMRDGTVTGITPGLAKVEARSQGRRASMAVLITGAVDTAVAGLPPGSVLTLEPASIALLPGENARITPLALLEDGSRVPPGRILWKSLRPDVADVDSTGLLIGSGPGRTIVQASTRDGLTATLPVQVEPAEFALSRPRLVLGPEDADTLRAVVPAQRNRPVRSGIQWRSSDTAVVRIGPTGIVTARAPGQAEILAFGFGQERRAEVMVHRVPESLVVSPRPAAGSLVVPLRASEKLTAIAEAADSTPIPEARFAWEVGDTAVVAFDPATTTLTGKSVGTTDVTVRLRGFEPVVWTVDVIPGVLGFERPLTGLTVGERTTLQARLLDDSSRVIGPATGLAWSTDRPEIIQVSGEGTIDGLAPGRAAVTATAPWGRSVVTEVVVTADLVLSSNRSGNFGIYQMRSTGVDTLLLLLVDDASNVQAVLSPDRTRIAFSSNRHGSYDLFVMNAGGDSLRRLTADGGTEGEPAWTPDGTRIVFTSTQPGAGSQLRTVLADGKDPRLLTNSPGGNHSPDVSPDGGTIAFVSAREGNQEIYLMDLSGGEARRVTRTEVRESGPRFLPGGGLVYVAERGGRSRGSRVLRVASEGAEAAMVLETDLPIASLSVSRDGERVAYVVGRLTDASRGKAQFSLFIHPLAPGAVPTEVPLRPGEQVVSPAF